MTQTVPSGLSPSRHLIVLAVLRHSLSFTLGRGVRTRRVRGLRLPTSPRALRTNRDRQGVSFTLPRGGPQLLRRTFTVLKYLAIDVGPPQVLPAVRVQMLQVVLQPRLQRYLQHPHLHCWPSYGMSHIDYQIGEDCGSPAQKLRTASGEV